MIYTVTFNPSLDYVVSLDSLHSGEVNRAENERIFPGGKGINVSIVLNNLEIPNVALGFTAGFTGDEIERRLNNDGIATDFIHLPRGLSRINVKLISDNTTDINARGPEITKEAITELYYKTADLQAGDFLVLAGAIPPSLPDFTYEIIMEKLKDKGIKIIVDATKELLLRTVSYKPFLIKPNIQELEELFSTRLYLKEDIIRYARELCRRGAVNVIVSLGAAGAILVKESGESLICDAPDGIVRNPVGAGDSMIAGFIYGYTKSASIEEAFRMSVAAGSASAFSDELAKRSDILALRNRIK